MVSISDGPVQAPRGSSYPLDMAKGTFEEKLTELERATAKLSPAAIIEQAAKIVDIDVEECLTLCVADVYRLRAPVSASSFREQWLLRWLLKKLGIPTSKPPEQPTADPEQRC